MYTLAYSKKAQKQLAKLDRGVQALILSWIEKNLLNCENPRQKGKGLTANRSGLWRYRVGDYRIISSIEDERLVILVVEVGHRKEIYHA